MFAQERAELGVEALARWVGDHDLGPLRGRARRTGRPRNDRDFGAVGLRELAQTELQPAQRVRTDFVKLSSLTRSSTDRPIAPTPA